MIYSAGMETEIANKSSTSKCNYPLLSSRHALIGLLDMDPWEGGSFLNSLPGALITKWKKYISDF